MEADKIEIGHCYHGRCCEGQFVIQVRNVTITGATGEKPVCYIEGELVFVNGSTLTDSFPTTVIAEMIMREIGNDYFKSIYRSFHLAQNMLTTMMDTLNETEDGKGQEEETDMDVRHYIVD